MAECDRMHVVLGVFWSQHIPTGYRESRAASFSN
jgi:hypothetical protein